MMETKIPFWPPKGDFRVRHKSIQGINIVRFLSSEIIVTENPDGHKQFGEGELSFFIYPDNEETIKMLEAAYMLNPINGEYWYPDLENFILARVGLNYSVVDINTEKKVYISKKLPLQIIVSNIQQVIFR